ncbi:MAG: Alanine racemase [Acidobacteriota bacterium]|nr:Alanine racemase [Acidobacteriota bacterium]
MVESAGGAPTLRRAWVESDLQALRRNFRRLAARVEPAKILAVVKADAYGHGAVAVARALELEGSDAIAGLAVATAEEAIELREAGVRARILVLSPLPPEAAPALRKYQLTPVISSVESLGALKAFSKGSGWVAPLHLKFDTGMTRLGIDAREASSLFELLRSSPEVRLEGVLSHLAEAETPESESNRLQQDRFAEILALLSAEELASCSIHLANSAAALHLPAARFDWVRLGIALYGYDSAGRLAGDLEPVLSVAAEIVQIKSVLAGTRVGYGGRWVAARASRIGIVPVGYADGYSWRLGNRAEVLVAGQRVPVVGSVSMDLLAVDVTGVPAQVGSRVTLLGRQGTEAISAVELAAEVGTIPYQLLCLFGLRLPRRIVDNQARDTPAPGRALPVESAP